MASKSEWNVKEKEYSDDKVLKELERRYGKMNCIRLKEFIYIIRQNDGYYFMKQTIPEIFSICEGTKLNKVKAIIEESDGSITVEIRIGTEKQIIMTSKPRIIERLLLWE